MDLDPSRLRRGELIVGASSIVLLASMFALKWYGLTEVLARTYASLGKASSSNGWHSLLHLRWLLLVTVLVGLALVFFQATRRAPALPVSLGVIATTLGLLSALALIYRVLIDQPGSGSVITQKPGAFVGLVSALGIVGGGYLSIRDEGIARADAPDEIETVRLPSTSAT